MNSTTLQWFEENYGTAGASKIFTDTLKMTKRADHFQEDLPIFLALFGFWCSYYLLLRYVIFAKKLKFNGKEQTEEERLNMCNSSVSLVHGSLSFLYGSYHMYYFSNPECGMVNDKAQRYCLMLSMAYFIYDSLCMLFEGTIDTFIVIHHIFAFMGLYFPYLENINGIYSMLGIFMGEISNPIMHTKNLLKLNGMKYTQAYEVSEIIFLIIYYIARALLAPPVIYQAIICPSVNVIYKLTCYILIF